MKFSKFKKNLKNEFNETISDEIEVKERKFSFKIRYAVIGLLIIFAAYLLIDHIAVLNYNKGLEKKIESQSNEVITEKKYNSKKELTNALRYTRISEKKSVLQTIGDMFVIKGCDSAVEVPETDVDIPKDTGSDSSYNTNVYEANIDEADVSKSDGTYIYSLCTYKNKFSIFDLSGRELSSLDTDALKLYVSNNKIVLIGRKLISIYKFNNGLELEKKFTINEYVDSRLTNHVLYYVDLYKLNVDSINYDNAYYDGCYDPNCLYKVYKVDLDTFETKEGDLVSSYGSSLYMSDNYFYFISSASVSTPIQYSHYVRSFVQKTTIFIIDYSLNGYSVIEEYGTYLNKYNFSEYEGKLRYVLSDNSKTYYNSLYVYDLASKKLEGSLTEKIGLEYETVKSVRFDKNLCYVCTFRNTDPLYKIDLSDSKNIKILSELKVPGYSDYLHKFKLQDKSIILGIGFDNASKISLYDDNDDLTQIGNSLYISSVNYGNTIFNSYYIVENEYTNGVINSNYLGYLFYIKDDILYFGAPVSSKTYTIFKINPNEDTNPITVYKEHKYNIENYDGLRCFLINSKLYFVGDGTIHIEDF